MLSSILGVHNARCLSMARTKTTVRRKGYTFLAAKVPKLGSDEGTCSLQLYYFSKQRTTQRYKNNKTNRDLNRVGKTVSRCVITKVPMQSDLTNH